MKKIILFILISISVFSLIGCNNIEEDKVIDFEVINYQYGYINAKEGCKVVNSEREYEALFNGDSSFKYYKNFDYKNYSIIYLRAQREGSFNYPIVTELKLEENKLIVDLYTKNKMDKYTSCWFIFIKVLKQDVASVEEVVYKENQYDYVTLTVDYYSGGCMGRIEKIIIPKGKKAKTETNLINLKTLEIYNKEIKTDEDLYLYPYKENGLDAHFIRTYVIENNDFEFTGGYYSIGKIKGYKVVKESNSFITIEHNNIKYSFRYEQYFDNPRLYTIESSEKLFNVNYEKAYEILSILYNNDSLFKNDLITIELTKEGYKITFPTYPIYG